MKYKLTDGANFERKFPSIYEAEIALNAIAGFAEAKGVGVDLRVYRYGDKGWIEVDGDDNPII